MKRGSGRLIFILLLFNCVAAGATGADIYASWTDLLSQFKDNNTGLTSFPTLLVPLGGLSEGMGTASTALSRDTGYIESNPAASALLHDTELSFYHHNWISDSNLEGVVYTVRFNDLGIGFGGKFLYVPFTAYSEWGSATAANYISETIGTMNVSYNFLSNYYFYGLALGANIKVAYRNIPQIFALAQSALAIMGDFGAMTSFNFLKFYSSQDKNFSVGAVVKNLGISTLADETLPQIATLGIAWSPLRPWTIAVDYDLPFNFAGQPAAESWSLATGTTVAITSFLSVQGGFLWSISDPRLSLGAELSLGTLNLSMNYNLDLSGSVNPLDKLSIEAGWNLGDSGRSANAKQAESLYLQGVEEYANGHYPEAIALWEQVLQIDPKYQPAADYIRTVKQTMALQDQLQTVGTK